MAWLLMYVLPVACSWLQVSQSYSDSCSTFAAYHTLITASLRHEHFSGLIMLSDVWCLASWHSAALVDIG